MDSYYGLESNFDTGETIQNGNPLIATRGKIYNNENVHSISPDNGLILGISSFVAILSKYMTSPFFDPNEANKLINDNFEPFNPDGYTIRFPYAFHTNYGTQVEYGSNQFYRFIKNKIKTIYRLKNTEYILIEINIKSNILTNSCFVIGKIGKNSVNPL